MAGHGGRTMSFGDFTDEPVPVHEAGFVVVPAPYEGSVSYIPGTALGPEALLDASRFLEEYDEELGFETYIESGGIATLDRITSEGPPETMEGPLRDAFAAVLERGAVPILIGGEHSLSLGPVRACRARHPDLAVLHFDAHCDLRQEYEGSPYSHACIMARVAGDEIPIVQCGIRSLSRPEAEWLRSEAGRRLVTTFFDHEHRPLAPKAEAVIDALPGGDGDPVYVSIDMDGFDPALVPGVGTPEPGGLSWHDVTAVLRACSRRRRIVGFDVLELRPVPGSVVSEFTAAKLVYRLMGYIIASKSR